MSRRVFSSCHLWSGPVHCRLSGTGVALLYCEWLVRTVRQSLFLQFEAKNSIYSCTGCSWDLDGDGVSRTRHDTDLKVTGLPGDILWDDYGIIADCVVSNRISLRKRLLTANTQPFTNDFPRADIHELIAPDLLHQVIKGTFKDHIVEWVNDYIIEAHGETRGLRIIADIDRR